MDAHKKAVAGEERQRRGSLVEKAANKLNLLAEDKVENRTGPGQTSSVEPTHQRLPQEQATVTPKIEPRPAIERAVAAETTETKSKTPPGQPRSREASVDFARLRRGGVITPNGVRTRITEEFRLIKRMILAKRWQDDTANSNLIMVTSAIPGEGKTFVSLNLAMSIACEQDLRVLLVDADVCQPSIPEALGIEAQKGLVDVLQDSSVNLPDVLIRTDINGLTILPSGSRHYLSTELLASQRMARLVDEMALRYADRVIIFDSPPLLATSEPSVLAQHVGQIIFVVRAEKTKRNEVRAALDILGPCENVGLLLNGARPQLGGAEFGYYLAKGVG